MAGWLLSGAVSGQDDPDRMTAVVPVFCSGVIRVWGETHTNPDAKYEWSRDPYLQTAPKTATELEFGGSSCIALLKDGSFYGSNGRTFSKANSLVAGSDFQTIAISGVKWTDSPQCSMVSFDAEPVAELRDWFADSLSMTCQALVLSTRPVPVRPLKIAISIPTEAADLMQDFTTAPGWTSGTGEGRTWFRCTFTWDPQTSQSIAGSIPGGSFEGLRFKSRRLAAGQ